MAACSPYKMIYKSITNNVPLYKNDDWLSFLPKNFNDIILGGAALISGYALGLVLENNVSLLQHHGGFSDKKKSSSSTPTPTYGPENQKCSGKCSGSCNSGSCLDRTCGQLIPCGHGKSPSTYGPMNQKCTGCGSNKCSNGQCLDRTCGQLVSCTNHTDPSKKKTHESEQECSRKCSGPCQPDGTCFDSKCDRRITCNYHKPKDTSCSGHCGSNKCSNGYCKDSGTGCDMYHQCHSKKRDSNNNTPQWHIPEVLQPYTPDMTQMQGGSIEPDMSDGGMGPDMSQMPDMGEGLPDMSGGGMPGIDDNGGVMQNGIGVQGMPGQDDNGDMQYDQ